MWAAGVLLCHLVLPNRDNALSSILAKEGFRTAFPKAGLSVCLSACLYFIKF